MRHILIIWVFFLSGYSVASNAVVIAPTKEIVNVGEKISVNVSNAPVDDEEWLGVYNRANKLLLWGYTGGISTGIVEFGTEDEHPTGYGALMEPDEYEIRLFSSSSARALTQARVIVKAEQLFINPKKNIYQANEKVTVAFSNATGNIKDWIGIYDKNETNNRKFIQWAYTNGSSSGETTLKGVDIAGNYEVRFFSNNSFTMEAKASFDILVNEPFEIELINNSYKLGENISVRLSNATGKSKDWVGIYHKNEPNNRNMLYWVYTNGVVNGQITLKGRKISGAYEARFFSNNSFKMEAKADFSILEQNIKQVTITLLSDISWIEPQVFYKNIDPSPWPHSSIQHLSIKSKKEIIKAYNINTQQDIPVIYFNGMYEVDIPSFEFATFIQIDYVSDEATSSVLSVSDWSDESLINGYTALSAGYYYKPYKWGDAFDNVERMMKNLGFSQYTRMVKGDTRLSSMMWNSLTIKDILNRYSYEQIEDSVLLMGNRALSYNLDFIAYYKDMGDAEALKSHPEWECKTPEGEITNKERKNPLSFIMMDYTTEWKNVVKNQLLELASRGVKGVYFDYIHSPQWGCYGTNMQELYEFETGLETPRKNNLGHHWSNHENWVSYMEFQGKKLEEAFSYWKKEIKQQYPDFQFIVSTTYVSGLTSAIHPSSIAEVADMTKVEFDHGRKTGLRHNVFQKDKDDDDNLAKPSDNILMMLAHLVPRDFSQKEKFHSWAYGFANTEQLKGFVISSLVLGGIPDIYIAEQYLRSDFDPNQYTPIFAAQTPYKGLQESIQLGKKLSKSMIRKKPLKFAGIYFDELVRNSYRTNYEAAWRDVIWPSVGAYESFLLEGMPVTAVSKDTIFKYINDFSVLYLPIAENLLPLNVQQLLINYENSGGVLIRRDKSLEWDSKIKNSEAYTLFRQKISQYKEESLFWIDKNESIGGDTVYSFFYQ